MWGKICSSVKGSSDRSNELMSIDLREGVVVGTSYLREDDSRLKAKDPFGSKRAGFAPDEKERRIGHLISGRTLEGETTGQNRGTRKLRPGERSKRDVRGGKKQDEKKTPEHMKSRRTRDRCEGRG